MVLRFERSPGWVGNCDSVSGSDPAVEKVNLDTKFISMHKDRKYNLNLLIQTFLF